jgi:hypothetical protein
VPGPGDLNLRVKNQWRSDETRAAQQPEAMRAIPGKKPVGPRSDRLRVRADRCVGRRVSMLRKAIGLLEELYPRTPGRFGGNGLLHDGSPVLYPLGDSPSESGRIHAVPG